MNETLLYPEFEIPAELKELAAGIRLVLFDVDGVLTDGHLYFDDSGNELKAFHSRDGLGINMLQDSGVEVGIITARKSNVVAHRAQDLKIRHLYQGAKDKYPAYEAMCKSLNLSPAEVAFVGDDVVDLPIMLDVGLAITVPDGHPLVKQRSHWTTPHAAGAGAARDVCELILYCQGNYASVLEPFLNRRNTA
jgi:3-deoxy-D-manno-octulosonate 8-phosphate phosphatase (KDO 8-P phosphatase)